MIVDADDRRAAKPLLALLEERSSADIERLGFLIGENAIGRVEPPGRIDDHAQGIWPVDQTGRQLRIVGSHGSRADDNGVAQGPQAMQMHDVFLPGDVARLAGKSRDEAVEALAEMADGDRVLGRGAADRKVEVENGGSRIVRRQSRQQFPGGAESGGTLCRGENTAPRHTADIER